VKLEVILLALVISLHHVVAAQTSFKPMYYYSSFTVAIVKEENSK